MVIEHDIGRSNALRVNYVQAWGEMAGGPGLDGQGTTVPNINPVDYQSFQFRTGNLVIDKPDIKRSGLRTYVTTIPYDFPNKIAATFAPVWAHWLSDWVVNGHLKASGTITLTGVTEPICIGDNFEWNGIVFHIEQITHSAQISPVGMLSFRTTLSMSNGLSVNTDETTRYPYMDNMYRETLQTQDQQRDQVYPGYTDVQDIRNRNSGELPKDRGSPDFNKKK
jgi:hypothetical protein